MIFGQESETIEFKKTTGEIKEAVVDVAAILNKHNRGELYFGIRNDGTVLGQMIADTTMRDVSRALTDNIKPQIYPTIENVSIDNKNCVRVLFEGENVPYFAYGKAYIRVADECKQLSPAELEEYFRKKTGISTWDSAPSGKTADDIDTNAIRSYTKRANESGRIDYKFTSRDDILQRLELISDGEPCNAAVAMFGKKPPTELQMAIFATDVKHTFIDIDRRKGTILDLVDAGESYIRRNIRWRVVIDGSPERTEIPEVPIVAIREALLNSYAHRDFRVPQTNEIAIYSNRIEIYNPGTFPEGLTPQDFIEGTGKSIRRNPLLAQIMYYSKDIESFGTGLQKIARECDAAGVRCTFELGKLGFSVIFYRPEIHENTISGSGEAFKTKILVTDKVTDMTEKTTHMADKVTDIINNVNYMTDKVAYMTDKPTDMAAYMTDKLTTREQAFLQSLQTYFAGRIWITNAAARAHTGNSESSVKRYLRSLTNKHVLEAQGKNKTRRYRLKSMIRGV